jgi:hypothetical protein
MLSLSWIAPLSAPGVDHETKQHAGVEARAADEEVVSRLLAARVDASGLVQPLAVGFEATCGQHAAACLDE